MPKENSVKAAESGKDDRKETVAFQEAPVVHEEAQSQATAGTQNVTRTEQVKETFTAQEGTTEQVVKSTVEELPQELAKVWPSRNSGDSHVLTVELEPVSLGKLTIRLEYEAGKAAVSIMASNPKTLELLNEKASELAGILKEHTGEETGRGCAGAAEPRRAAAGAAAAQGRVASADRIFHAAASSGSGIRPDLTQNQ